MPHQMKTRPKTKETHNANIIHCVYRYNAVVDYEDVVQETTIARALSGGRRSPALKDIRRVNSISVEAREHLSCRETTEQTYCAVALMVASPVSKVIGNFFIGLNKPTHPVRLFSDESSGLEWLKEHLR